MDKLSDVAPLWDQTDNKHHNSSLKPKFWDKVREKFDATSTDIVTLMNEGPKLLTYIKHNFCTVHCLPG